MLSKIIIAKLNENHRVVIPGLGVFIMREDGRVLFSELMRDDDGVLRSALVSEHGMGEIEAARMVERFAADIHHSLDHGMSYRLEGLGALSIDERGLAVFKGREEELRRVAERSTRAALDALLADEARAESERRQAAARIAAEAAPAEPVVKEPAAAVTEQKAEASAEQPEHTDAAVQPEQPVQPERPEPVRRPVPRPRPKRRRGADIFLIVAIVIAVIAIGVMVFGFWVASRNEDSSLVRMFIPSAGSSTVVDDAPPADDVETFDLSRPSGSI